MTLENVIPSLWYSISSSNVTFNEKPDAGTGFPAVLGDNKNIQGDQPIEFNFQWTQMGFFCPSLSGSFKCDVFFESLSNSSSFTHSALPTPYYSSSGAIGHTYNVTTTIPANSIAQGVYRITARLLYIPGGYTTSPIAAFQDLGLCEVYVG